MAENILKIDTNLDQGIRNIKIGDQSTPLDLSRDIVNYKGKEIATKNDLHDDTVGSVIGYTRIADTTTTTGNDTITIGTSFATLQTAGSTDVSITFTAPLSGNVEILFSAYVYSSSKTVSFGLSDNSSYNEVDEIHTYDNGAGRHDETDRYVYNIPFCVTGLTSGTSYTYYIGAKASGSSAYIYHGRFRTTGAHYPPIIVKATALPSSITTGA